MAERNITRRVAFDADDTLVDRGRGTRLGAAIKGRLFLPAFKYTLDALPDFDDKLTDQTGVDRVSFWFSNGRSVIPGVAEKLRQRVIKGEELHVISGRPATVEWFEMTRDQLISEGIPIIQDRIHLTPPGTSTIAFKAATIKALEIEEFTDDNWRTIFILARLYPERMFNWIRYSLTDARVTKALLSSIPNVKEIPINEWRERGKKLP